jgi:hypothetical protein
MGLCVQIYVINVINAIEMVNALNVKMILFMVKNVKINALIAQVDAKTMVNARIRNIIV